MTFRFTPLDLPEVLLVEPTVHGDERGWFAETYRASAFRQAGIDTSFVQDNHARSIPRGVLRGIHWQAAPLGQGKLVRCVAGAAFDVAVDLRPTSATFGRWVGIELTPHTHRQLWIPEDFGHAYCTLEDNTEIVYKVTREYARSHDRAVRWNDPDIGIAWPVADPILSDRDRAAPLLHELPHKP